MAQVSDSDDHGDEDHTEDDHDEDVESVAVGTGDNDGNNFEDEIIPLTELPDALASLEAGATGAPERLTSILVAPTGFVETNQIWQDFYVDTRAQAVFPGEELGRLFDLLQQAEQVLTVIGYLVLVIAALTLFLSIYSVTRAQQHEIAIMRSVGGSRATIFRVVMLQALLITLIGALLGRLVGYGAAASAAFIIANQSEIPISIGFLTDLEPTLWVLTLVVGVIAGLVPAMLAYRVDVVDNLFAT
ncbi:MAG: ABC transporter permease [Chloroflexota bacterium]